MMVEAIIFIVVGLIGIVIINFSINIWTIRKMLTPIAQYLDDKLTWDRTPNPSLQLKTIRVDGVSTLVTEMEDKVVTEITFLTMAGGGIQVTYYEHNTSNTDND